MIQEMKETIDHMAAQFKRYEPLIERYELASQANSFLKQRRALKKGVG